MGRGGEAADWTSDPKDSENLIRFFHRERQCLGDGVNPDKQLLNDAAVLHACKILGAPKHGGPKTPDTIRSRWATLRKLHDYIEQALQKNYPGASGWTYTHELGFNVTPESMDAWRTFLKAGNSHFKPFTNKGWDLWEVMHETLPTRAKGKYVFNAASGRSSRSQAHEDLAQSLTQSNNDSQSSETSSQSSAPSQPISNWSQSDYGSSQSQPISNWSQSDYGRSQSPGDLDGRTDMSGLDQLGSAALQVSQRTPSTTQPTAPPLAPVVPTAPAPPAPPATPANVLKRAASDETDGPWSNKHTKTTGPEAIMFLGRGVMDIGGALRECFGNKSSGLSPTKELLQARKLAEEDEKNKYITSDVRLRLSLLFGRDISAADAYIAEGDGFNRTDLARILLPDLFF
ncbi:hypothetical protein DFH07DRAFT_950983 [Mycena maculata]|uniref:Myb/SANT-like domain-containing protein n=1 Tax=Mycena maculata TaxID=230809 RepID=A0AAD7K630_9AGAR|nr:hypothetical protein DFH07DRAFT_950983 [Mycena maculata]